MKKTIRIIKNLVFYRSCCLCRSFDTECEIICNICWLKLLAHFQMIQNRKIEKIEVIALFSWIPGLGYNLSQLLYRCKKLKSKQAWGFLAEEWLRRSVGRQVLSKNTKAVLVPIPSQTGRNHAHNFALALSELTGFPVLAVLQFQLEQNQIAPNLEQKRLNKKSRAQRAFQISVEFTKILKEADRIILVDDVITTGATARAAERALGSVQIELWCLADRRQLAASS